MAQRPASFLGYSADSAPIRHVYLPLGTPGVDYNVFFGFWQMNHPRQRPSRHPLSSDGGEFSRP